MAKTTQLDKPKHAGGRPPKYTDAELEIIRQDFEDYLAVTPDPIIVGFTSSYTKYPVNKQFMFDRSEFSSLVKRAVEKQEYYLQFGAIQNKLNPTFAIFRLKQPQHGWTDRTQQDLTTNGKDLPVPILGNVNVQRNNGDEQNLIP